MSLFDTISKDLIDAIKSRKQDEIRALQGIKAQLLLLRSEKGPAAPVSADEELKALMKMAKQRRDSLEIFERENRQDLAQKEMEELRVIDRYLPAQLSDEELESGIRKLIGELGVSSMAQMGMVMGKASQVFSGRADGKRISEIVKRLLS